MQEQSANHRNAKSGLRHLGRRWRRHRRNCGEASKCRANTNCFNRHSAAGKPQGSRARERKRYAAVLAEEGFRG